ncbi:5286_t:CDS:2 [Ambispora leptoticha]|uniref:5286_t:CDS:1 n=1 Tax=Ambispora leptoticha TaxID=144679 RepID=A0A9N9GR99_9GLOM|nr:5286_t:CDS:2 [Ambispora leptoticha]
MLNAILIIFIFFLVTFLKTKDFFTVLPNLSCNSITTTDERPVFEKNITQCTRIPPRLLTPESVHDLRPDDIKYVMALGDSITAGFAAKGRLCNGSPLTLRNLNENRGVSFAAGGDENAETIPNFINFYRGDVVGASVGDHLVEVCAGKLCPKNQYRPEVDRLNAAQSAASVVNLLHEVQYLLEQLKKMPADFTKSFKFMNLLIGANDICNICTTEKASPHEFESNLRATLEIIEQNVPNTIVNIMGLFNVSQVYAFSKGKSYCRWLYVLPQVQFGCACAFLPGRLGEINRARMDEITMKYNQAIQRIIDDYASRPPKPSFGLIYQQFNLNLMTFPIEAVSNIDCFHPSLLSHQYTAKVIWNNLPVPQFSRNPDVVWDPDLGTRCLMEDDRIRTIHDKS